MIPFLISCMQCYFSGYFLYIETSKPRQPGDAAILRSKLYLPSGDRCLQFYYHMYGGHIDTLKVLYSSGGIDTPIWEKSQDQGNQWLLARVNIPFNGSPYRVCYCFHWSQFSLRVCSIRRIRFRHPRPS